MCACLYHNNNDTILLSHIKHNIIIHTEFYIILCDYYDDVYAMILCMYIMFSMHIIIGGPCTTRYTLAVQKHLLLPGVIG